MDYTYLSTDKQAPSALTFMSLCPQFRRKPMGTLGQMDKAADEGVQLHEIMEELVPWYMNEGLGGDITAKLAQLAPDPMIRYTIQKAFETLRPDLDLFAGGECLVEHKLKPGVTRDGYADLILLNDTKTYAHVEDYKMVRLKANHSYQLKAYAIGVFEEFPTVDRVCCVINSPRLEVDREPEYYSRSQLQEIRKDLEDLMAKAACPFSPPQPCDVCEICRWNGMCPAQHTLAETATTALGYPALGRILSGPQTPAERALRRYVVDALRQYAEKVREDDNAEAERTGDIPLGYTKITRAATPTLKAGANRDVIERLTTLCGVPVEVIHAYSDTNLKALSAAVAEFTGEAPKTVLRDMHSKLADLYEPGVPFSYLQKTSRKPLSELFQQVASTALLGG